MLLSLSLVACMLYACPTRTRGSQATILNKSNTAPFYEREMETVSPRY